MDAVYVEPSGSSWTLSTPSHLAQPEANTLSLTLSLMCLCVLLYDLCYPVQRICSNFVRWLLVRPSSTSDSIPCNLDSKTLFVTTEQRIRATVEIILRHSISR